MNALRTWSAIAGIVFSSTAGDVLLSRAMRQIGHVGELWRRQGLRAVLKAIVTHPSFLLALFFMAASFFGLLLALSWADVSLVVPATASLTYVTNAFAARLFLHEHVDRRRWISALLVCAGVAVLAT
ncbi:MAG TPA: EamA family transporter [Terriglobales bacterium]|jgi:drug/metabolite transporter (DMT)-like permease|nr:EamA family transporter [Terriglobales bacterium]